MSKVVLFALALMLAFIFWIHVNYMEKLEMLEGLAIQLSEITYTRGCVEGGGSFHECQLMSKNGDIEYLFKQVK